MVRRRLRVVGDCEFSHKAVDDSTNKRKGEAEAKVQEVMLSDTFDIVIVCQRGWYTFLLVAL